MKSIALSAIATLLVFSGCATQPHIENLKPPQSTREPVALTENLCMTFVGAFGKDAEVCLMSGTYRLDKENTLGQFFLGDLPSVYWKLGRLDEFVLVKGGVWVPRNTATLPRIFYYPGAPASGRASTVAELEAKRTSTQGAKPTSDTLVLDTMIQRSTPANATPLQAGVGGAVAMLVVTALASGEPQPLLYPEPKTSPSVESIQNLFSSLRKAP